MELISLPPPGRPPGHGGDRDQPGDVGARVGDEGLAAVDRPLAVGEDGGRAGAAGVAAGAGLGQTERTERLPAAEQRQPFLLLLLRAEPEHRHDHHLGTFGSVAVVPLGPGASPTREDVHMGPSDARRRLGQFARQLQVGRHSGGT
jgi:hypothetical protein